MAVALASNALTTVEEVRDRLGILGNDQNDRLTRLVNAASDYIERKLDRKLYREVITNEKVIGEGTDKIVLSRRPIVSISEIRYKDQVISSSSYEILGDGVSGIVQSTSGGFVWTAHHVVDVSFSKVPGTELQSFEVDYTGGYYLPSDSANRNLPYDLEEACISLVISRYNSLTRDQNIKSERILSYGVTYFDRSVSPEVQEVLNHYRSWVI